MTDRQFSHYVVSVSGKKGLGPWLVDDGDEGIHIVNDLARRSSSSEAGTRSSKSCGWTMLEQTPWSSTRIALGAHISSYPKGIKCLLFPNL